MHLLIPFAGVSAEPGREALRTLALPQLGRLLSLLTATRFDQGEEESLTPPHERALGDLLGWQAADGLLPWAAFHAAADGIDVGVSPWGELTPVHVQVGASQLTLLDPAALELGAEESRACLEAVRGLFETAGWRLAWGGDTRWYASHPSLSALPTASLDRAVGRNLEAFVPQGPDARPIRALQNEVQMLLYQWPGNDERAARGGLPINSFWVSGCGVRQPTAALPDLTVAEHLRAPALAGDWAAWAEGWRLLDVREVAECLAALRDGGEPVAITLCGERHARTFEARPVALWQRLSRRFKTLDPLAVLEDL